MPPHDPSVETFLVGGPAGRAGVGAAEGMGAGADGTTGGTLVLEAAFVLEAEEETLMSVVDACDVAEDAAEDTAEAATEAATEDTAEDATEEATAEEEMPQVPKPGWQDAPHCINISPCCTPVETNDSETYIISRASTPSAAGAAVAKLRPFTCSS